MRALVATAYSQVTEFARKAALYLSRFWSKKAKKTRYEKYEADDEFREVSSCDSASIDIGI